MEHVTGLIEGHLEVWVDRELTDEECDELSSKVSDILRVAEEAINALGCCVEFN